jgi:alpha-amylase
MKVVRIALAVTLSIALAVASEPVKAQDSIQTEVGLSKDLIYFVMPDRYLNGDLKNDDLPGYEPTKTAFFHGGDLRGLTGNCQDDNGLARIKSLGFTAVWMTPLVVQQPPTSGGAGYHGYWGTDFLNVDPHLGETKDLVALSDCAKKLGLKLILDVVTNHTGDIIWYNDRTAYVPEKFVGIKNPQWLNDLANYHNVGDINRCWSKGSCEKDGDFYGLDDLATEKREVYSGWSEVYGSWIRRFGFSGFRVDTARHVDDGFFKNWSPLILKEAEKAGISDFTIFGEVWEQSPTELMKYLRINKLQTALDFPFQRVAIEFASSYSSADSLRNLFNYDDYYTDKNSSAKNLVTFLGNHDMGRVAFLIQSKKLNPESQLLSRVKLAHSLLYLSRGIPAVYYGDEVGMTGSGNGNDQLARQDMFSTKVEMWRTEKRVGSDPVGTGDSFRFHSHPLSEHLRSLAKIRLDYPALANGQMQIRYAKGPIFAFSKLAPDSNQEFVVVMNNSSKKLTAKIPTASNSVWDKVFGDGSWRNSKADLEVSIPALEVLVLKARNNISETSVKIKGLKLDEDFLTGFYSVSAQVSSRDLLKTEFFVKRDKQWISLGIDTSAPFKYYLNPTEFSSRITIKATSIDSKGKVYEYRPLTFTPTSS